MPQLDKTTLIFLVEGLMDKETRPGTLKMAMPFVEQGVTTLLENAIDAGVNEAKAEAGKQLGKIMQGRGSGDPQNDMKSVAGEMVKASLKGVLTGVLDTVFTNKS